MKLDKSQRNTGATTPWVEYFRPYGIPPSPLHEALQNAAMQAGWIPPWDREQEQDQKVVAGKRSGSVRAFRVQTRRFVVKAAFERLKPPYRVQPFSNDSITALELEYRRILVEDVGDNDAELLMSLAPYKANRETLIKDLKALGIRSQRRKQISG
jgi:hypothetical protein